MRLVTPMGVRRVSSNTIGWCAVMRVAGAHFGNKYNRRFRYPTRVRRHAPRVAEIIIPSKNVYSLNRPASRSRAVTPSPLSLGRLVLPPGPSSSYLFLEPSVTESGGFVNRNPLNLLIRQQNPSTLSEITSADITPNLSFNLMIARNCTNSHSFSLYASSLDIH